MSSHSGDRLVEQPVIGAELGRLEDEQGIGGRVGYAEFGQMVEVAGVVWGRSHKAMTSQFTDRIAVNFDAELTKIVPGRADDRS